MALKEIEYSEVNPTVMGCWAFLALLGGACLNFYDLWRDWQHHRFVWMHWVGLLLVLHFFVAFCRAARRAWKKTRGQD